MFENWFRPARSPALKDAPEKKSGFSPLIALSLAGRAKWGARDYAAMARCGVMRNAIVYRCVRMIASAAASVPWLLYDGSVELEEHPLLALLKLPNPQEDGASLFERWYAYLQCAGNAYLEAGMIDGDPRALYVLRPDRVTVVPGVRGWPAAYDYTLDNNTTRIAALADGFLPVLHATLFHPLDDHYGFSPMQAAAGAIEVHNAGAD